MAYALVLGTSAERLESSNLSLGTIKESKIDSAKKGLPRPFESPFRHIDKFIKSDIVLKP